MSCRSYCSHGGVCILEEGHKGKHDSRYCRWTDQETLSKAEADQLLMNKARKEGIPGFGEFVEDFNMKPSEMAELVNAQGEKFHEADRALQGATRMSLSDKEHKDKQNPHLEIYFGSDIREVVRELNSDLKAAFLGDDDWDDIDNILKKIFGEKLYDLN